MSEFNEFDNVQKFSTENAEVQAQPVQQAAPEQKHVKKSKGLTVKVMALIAAVAVVGGGAGFGGAYIAGRSMQKDAVVSGSGNSHYNTSDNIAAPVESSSVPTLNELQQNAAIKHNISDTIEYNSDGTYKYTRDLVKEVQDSIVYIEVFVESRGKSTLYGSASGIIISKDGYIVTNNHVVEDADSFTVKVNDTDPVTGLSESETYDAELIGTDADTDLAVLKIKANDLPAAVLGDSDQLHLGDDVVVIGNPLGLENSVTKGIVSGLNRQISDSARGLSSIQTDTGINSGNSGGAMFNGYGEVVGVVNCKFVADYAESLGFAITINEAKGVVDDLITKGYVSGRAVLGISYNAISEYAAALRGWTPGLLVASINQDMAVAHSGLAVGDTIIEIEGESVLGDDTTDTAYKIGKILVGKKPGDVITVTVVRTDSLGREKKVNIEVELSEYVGN
ncbi:MAG: trypsin-like peptidase domain-containing protein [Oscillospiraceae bacterium]|nr:trypsin-like peptidase domain-containing protein [Oscillospiraceae bacterium]